MANLGGSVDIGPEVFSKVVGELWRAVGVFRRLEGLLKGLSFILRWLVYVNGLLEGFLERFAMRRG